MMGWGLKGLTVTVLHPVPASTDPFGAPVPGTPAPEDVADVLVDNPTSTDIESTVRQYGVSCDLTLHFPKDYTGSLRGCSVELPAPWSDEFEVMGDPMPYDPALVPTSYGMPVHVRRVSG